MTQKELADELEASLKECDKAASEIDYGRFGADTNLSLSSYHCRALADAFRVGYLSAMVQSAIARLRMEEL